MCFDALTHKINTMRTFALTQKKEQNANMCFHPNKEKKKKKKQLTTESEHML